MDCRHLYGLKTKPAKQPYQPPLGVPCTKSCQISPCVPASQHAALLDISLAMASLVRCYGVWTLVSTVHFPLPLVTKMSATTAPTPVPSFSPAYLEADRSQELINVCIVFLILETIFVGLFFATRLITRIEFGWDAYLMIPAYVFALTPIIVCFRKFHLKSLGRKWGKLALT